MSGLVAYWHGGVLYRRFGLRTSLLACFSLSFFAFLLLMGHGLQNQESWTFPLQIVCAEYGIAAGFTIIYVAHNSVFPVLFSATALGLCNFVARIFAALAPIVAQIDQPYPVIVYGVLVTASAFSVRYLRLKED